MKITYIEHSSFLVEMQKCNLIFDYYQGEVPELNTEIPLYVFVSHRHGDHFSKKIFQWAEKYPHIFYIISDDIWQNRVPEELYSRIAFIGPGEKLELDGLQISAFQSTDEGVAFLLKVEDKVIYHAGDLNNWYWEGEDPNWNRSIVQKYHAELDKIHQMLTDHEEWNKIHVAFLPLDSRQEKNFYLGMDEFMKQVGAEIVFPMHFWEDYSVFQKIKEMPCSENYRDRIMEIHNKGEAYDIN